MSDRASELRAIADGRLLLNVRNGVTVSRSMLARIADELDAERAALAKARRERDEARSIVRDIHWMAVRYADNRRSYAVGMCNDALRKAYDGGWLVYSDDKQHDLDPQYARDGMFDTEWRSAVDAANSRALEAEAQRDEALKALGMMLKEHDILSGNFGDVMDPKHKRPDRWPTAAEAARRAIEAHGGEDVL